MVMANLTALGIGIISFAIVIGVGTVILSRFASSVAECSTGYTYNGNGSTGQLCYNDTSTLDNPMGPGTGTENTNFLTTQLGETGLAGWTPAIIALVVGLLFLGAFVAKKGEQL